jgi:tetratricopeptide (TPR) repeat protein
VKPISRKPAKQGEPHTSAATTWRRPNFDAQTRHTWMAIRWPLLKWRTMPVWPICRLEGQCSPVCGGGTAAIFAAANDLRRQGMALGNRAAALEALERPEEAIEAYQQSADVLEQAGEDQLRANVMNSLSMLQFRSGRQLQALASMQNGLEGVKKPSPRQKFLKQLVNIPFQMMNRGKKDA